MHDQGGTHAGIVPGAGNPFAAGWLPQPTACQEASRLPLPGRAAKLPAASRTYCSAVSRNGCSSPGRERPSQERGRGGAGWETSPDADTASRVGLPACLGRPSQTHQAFPHLSSQDGIPRGRACHCPACWWPSQAASRKGFMVTCLPAECLETVPGGRVLLKWCCSVSPSHTLAGNAAPLGLETVGDGDHRPGRPWTLACALAGREAFASACFVGVS